MNIVSASGLAVAAIFSLVATEGFSSDVVQMQPFYVTATYVRAPIYYTQTSYAGSGAPSFTGAWGSAGAQTTDHNGGSSGIGQLSSGSWKTGTNGNPCIGIGDNGAAPTDPDNPTNVGEEYNVKIGATSGGLYIQEVTTAVQYADGSHAYFSYTEAKQVPAVGAGGYATFTDDNYSPFGTPSSTGAPATSVTKTIAATFVPGGSMPSTYSSSPVSTSATVYDASGNSVGTVTFTPRTGGFSSVSGIDGSTFGPGYSADGQLSTRTYTAAKDSSGNTTVSNQGTTSDGNGC